MLLDINTELYPLAVGDNIRVVLATSLQLDGTKDDTKGWRDANRVGLGGEATLADMFDYVCHGKIYRFEDQENSDLMYVFQEAVKAHYSPFAYLNMLYCAMNGFVD